MDLAFLKKSAREYGLLRLSRKTGLARSYLYKIIDGSTSPTIDSLEKLISELGYEIEFRRRPITDSVEEVTKLVAEGGDWKIHYFNFVDAFRKSRRVELIREAPHKNLSPELLALIASITRELCLETRVSVPDWANRRYTLSKPWFVSGMESLKAFALVESPASFRSNNIFVLENFLSRV